MAQPAPDRLPPLRRHERAKIEGLARHVNGHMQAMSTIGRAHAMALMLAILQRQFEHEQSPRRDWKPLLRMTVGEAAALRGALKLDTLMQRPGGKA